MSLATFFQSFRTDAAGYQFMWLILFFLIIAVALIIERSVYIYVRSNVNAKRFMAEITKLVSAGDFKKAIALCKSAGSKALPHVVLRALIVAEQSEIVDFRAVQNAVDEAGLEVIPKLNKRTGYLAAIGNIATLTGLLGTIFGLIISFSAVGQAGGGSEMLTAGIAVAMQTTMWGLVVAIPSLIAYTLLQAQTQAILDDIDEYGVKLIHLLTGGR